MTEEQEASLSALNHAEFLVFYLRSEGKSFAEISRCLGFKSRQRSQRTFDRAVRKLKARKQYYQALNRVFE